MSEPYLDDLNDFRELLGMIERRDKKKNDNTNANTQTEITK